MARVELVWDKKRLVISAVLVTAFLIGAYFAKILVFDKRETAHSSGAVAGTSADGEASDDEIIRPPSKEELEDRIKNIKKEVSELTPADIANQEPVKKILGDLESLKATTEAQVVNGAKTAVCEKAKEIFCKQ